MATLPDALSGQEISPYMANITSRNLKKEAISVWKRICALMCLTAWAMLIQS